MARTSLSFDSDESLRLDKYLSLAHPDFSRSSIAKLIDQGRVEVNAKAAKPATVLHCGDKTAYAPDLFTIKAPPKVRLKVIYEDDFCIVVDKPSGMITHAKGMLSDEASVASFIAGRIDSSLSGNRAGIVHRLDRGTSGVMIAAKTDPAQKYLQRQFAKHQAKKSYAAIVQAGLTRPMAQINMAIERNPKQPATFRTGANGKTALTQYELLSQNDRYTLLKLTPETGRTHQLRVHLRAIGHPIVGDTIYGGEPAGRLMLHAYSLSVILPDKGRVTFTSRLPEVFSDFVMIKDRTMI